VLSPTKPPRTRQHSPPGGPGVVDRTGRYRTSGIERDHEFLKERLRPMRGLNSLKSPAIFIRGHALMRNIRRRFYRVVDSVPQRMVSPTTQNQDADDRYAKKPIRRVGGHEILALSQFPCSVNLVCTPAGGSATNRRDAPRCQDFLARVAPRCLVPVNQPGLADRRATQRVDGGSASAVAAGRRARSRAGAVVRRHRAFAGAPVGFGRVMSNVRMLVGCVPQYLFTRRCRPADCRSPGCHSTASPPVSLPREKLLAAHLRRAGTDAGGPLRSAHAAASDRFRSSGAGARRPTRQSIERSSEEADQPYDAVAAGSSAT
jgi:hypothetical protein